MDLSEFKDIFLAEAQEHVETLNTGLLDLEREPQNEEALAKTFRAAHSLKGAAATMGYEDVARLAHALEDRLDALRQGKCQLTSDLADLLFRAVDVLNNLLSDIAANRSTEINVDEWIHMLEQIGKPGEPKEPQSTTKPPVSESDNTSEVKTPTKQEETPEEDTRILPNHTNQPQTIRVNTRHLDALLNVVAELIVSRSHLWRVQETHNLPDLKEALEKHDRLLSELRDAVLQTRMVPVAHIFNRFPRMVRDLLREHGKEAEFIIEGHDIELDRTILERMRDPLTHLLRNAVDHGIEPPEERERAGKPRRGRIWLRAHRERESVVIEVADDGRGLRREDIVRKAVQQGLITPAEAEEMSDAQVFRLICEPGFSTADQVTSVSGRGVGMDVVLREVEALHGSLTIESEPGKGTTFRVRLPLTLAIIQALLVRVGQETYAIPLSQVERTLEVLPESVTEVQKWKVITDEHSHALPLISLADLLEVPEHARTNNHIQYAVVVGEERHRVGLLVDRLVRQEEIVIRPLPAILGSVPGIAGASILGEGQIILILDVTHLLLQV